MTTYLFPDNTVLCNFACVNRLDLLRAALNGRGRWTEAVAFEASRSAAHAPALTALGADRCLGEPVEIDDPSDVQKIEAIRRVVFGGDDHNQLKHLGEAQTCYIIKNWTEFAGAWWISDDRDALRYARFQGITTRETIDIMSMVVADGEIGAGDAFDLMHTMSKVHDRRLRLPEYVRDLQR
ncbi:hypothetical protein [Herbidospora sp. NBRC 101105]|uniref:hypothetical protein n=1 Tax=Herbidospora sp. NBRC 101105 TaxID=3032195 RepID=UPI00249FFF89|nr:hypothetical protein [Herbidospora sp. NBRC 101105]GLX98728.1 hypothetical protein Hesp01_66780 [Herbidospora sp. NBRC 101105]